MSNSFIFSVIVYVFLCWFLHRLICELVFILSFCYLMGCNIINFYFCPHVDRLSVILLKAKMSPPTKPFSMKKFLLIYTSSAIVSLFMFLCFSMYGIFSFYVNGNKIPLNVLLSLLIPMAFTLFECISCCIDYVTNFRRM